MDLIAAYVRRQRYLARVQAAEIGALFGGKATTAPAREDNTVVGASGKRYQRVSADVILARAMAP